MVKWEKMNTHVACYAFRYALGRQTGAVDTMACFITDNLDNFKDWELEQIVRETQNAIDLGHAGMDMDVDDWKRMINRINTYLEEKKDD